MQGGAEGGTAAGFGLQVSNASRATPQIIQQAEELRVAWGEDRCCRHIFRQRRPNVKSRGNAGECQGVGIRAPETATNTCRASPKLEHLGLPRALQHFTCLYAGSVLVLTACHHCTRDLGLHAPAPLLLSRGAQPRCAQRSHSQSLQEAGLGLCGRRSPPERTCALGRLSPQRRTAPCPLLS